MRDRLTKPQDAVPVEMFQEALRSVCGAFDVDPSDKGGLVRGNVRQRRFARLDAAEVVLDASRVSRGARALSGDPGSHFFAIIQLDGYSIIRQADTCAELTKGKMCIVDSSQTSEFVYPKGASYQLSLHLPRAEMINRFGHGFDRWCHLPQAQQWFPMISAIVEKLIQADDKAVCEQLEESLLSLLGASLHAVSGGDRYNENRYSALHDRARSAIRANCADPGFCPTQLADHLGVSYRTLQRHFQLIGETPGRCLLEARLERAYQLLTTTARGSRDNVTAIAYNAGFSDLSHFHRAFRKRYGATPGEMKSRH